MQIIDKVNSNNSKYPFCVIYDIFNTIAADIRSTNEQILIIRKSLSLLETKNETLFLKLKDIVNALGHVECKDTSTQSETTKVSDVGIHSIDVVQCFDANIDIDETVVEVTVGDNNESKDEEEVTVSEQKVTELQPSIDNPSYIKNDMLSYLERYKISFLSFVRCNKDDIEHISIGCHDLIRRFSKASDYQKKRRKERLISIRKAKNSKKHELIDKVHKSIDEGVKSSGLENQEPICIKAETVTKSKRDHSKTRGTKDEVTSTNKSTENPLEPESENVTSKKTVDPVRPPTTERAKEKHKKDSKNSEKPTLAPPLTDKSHRKSHPGETKTPKIASTLSVVKYDLSNADSPLFEIKPCTLKPSKEVLSSLKKPKAPINEIVPESKTDNKHSHRNDERKIKKKHTSKKKSSNRAKCVEDSEVG